MGTHDGGDRPESLPQQVGRIASRVAAVAHRTRERWTPAACVLMWVLLIVGLSVARHRSAQPQYALLPSFGWCLLLGLTSSSVLLVGLGTALSAERFARRWLTGAAVVGLLIVTHACAEPDRYDAYGSVLTGLLAEVSHQGGRWALWITVGIGVRVATKSAVAKRGSVRSGSQGLRVGDLLLLTAIVAVSFGCQRWWVDRYATITPVETAPSSGVLALLYLPVTLLLTPMTIMPVLAAAFPTARIRPVRLFVAAAVTVVLSTAVGLLRDAMLRDAMRGAIPAITLPPLWHAVFPRATTALGMVAGIVVVALWLRWAGYQRIRRSCDGPVRER